MLRRNLSLGKPSSGMLPLVRRVAVTCEESAHA
jgi:hypothetical protein